MANRIEGDLFVSGAIVAGSINTGAGSITGSQLSSVADIARTQLVQNALVVFPVNFMDLRVHDAIQTNLPGTSASDDLGLYGGTFGSTGPLVRTYDVKNAGAQTLYARFFVPLPAEYDPGETVTLRIKAGMVTTVASVSATLDVEAFEVDKQGSVGSDICATSAQSINSLTFANKEFTITPTTLAVGDWLDVRITIAVNDSGTGTAVIAAIGTIELMCDIRG